MAVGAIFSPVIPDQLIPDQLIPEQVISAWHEFYFSRSFLQFVSPAHLSRCKMFDPITDPITVTLKLFAAYQEAYGVSELVLKLPAGMTVAQVRDRLISEHPELAPLRDLTRFGVNLQFVEPDVILQTGDEIVLIPPVSGG